MIMSNNVRDVKTNKVYFKIFIYLDYQILNTSPTLRLTKITHIIFPKSNTVKYLSGIRLYLLQEVWSVCVTSINIAIMQIQGVYGAGMAETAITENSPMFPLRLYVFC